MSNLKIRPGDNEAICPRCGRKRGEHTYQRWHTHQKKLKEPPKRLFTSEEDRFITENWEQMSLSDIGKQLNRRYDVVRARGYRILLTPKPRCLSKKVEDDSK